MIVPAAPRCVPWCIARFITVAVAWLAPRSHQQRSSLFPCQRTLTLVLTLHLSLLLPIVTPIVSSLFSPLVLLLFSPLFSSIVSPLFLPVVPLMSSGQGGWCGYESTARGESWPEIGDQRVRVWIVAAPHAAVDEPLVGRIVERARRKFAAAFPTLVPDVALAPDAVRLWLAAFSIDAVNAAKFREWVGDDHRKTIVVDVRYERGGWQLAGVEYDGYFAQVGKVRRGYVVQRAMVAEQSAAWALRCYSPVGRIAASEEEFLMVDFPALERLRGLAESPTPVVGSVLRIYRERWVAGAGDSPVLAQEPRDDQFLVVAEDRGTRFATRLAVPGQEVDKQYFQGLGNPAAPARFLARLVDPAPGLCRVRVVSQADGDGTTPRPRSPREGCVVYVSPLRPSRQDLARPLGVTDDRGEFSLEAPAGLRYVVITQGVSMYYRPFVPGCSPATLEFVVPYRPQRLDLGETLNRLGDNLRDRRARFTDLLKRLRATIESADVEAARKLAEDSEQLGDIKSLEAELAAVNQEAVNAKYDIEPLHGQLVKELQAFRDEVRDAAVATAASQAEIQGLRRRINDLWPKKRAWDELKAKLDRLAVLDPKDDAVNRRREWLNEALRADPPEMANARETVDQAIRLSDSSRFVDDWSKLHPALERLLDASDLWLLRVADAFPNWESLVAKEKSRLDADIKTLESGGTKEDAKRLEERQAKLTTATKQLAAVNERLDPVVNGLLQKAPM